MFLVPHLPPAGYMRAVLLLHKDGTLEPRSTSCSQFAVGE
jgi:hypothetical protein